MEYFPPVTHSRTIEPGADAEDLGGTRAAEADQVERPAAPAGATVVPAAAGTQPPGWLRGGLEALAIAVATLALAMAAVPAFRDGRQTLYQDVLVNAMGPDRLGLARWLKDGIFPLWLRGNYGGEPYLANTQHGTLYPGNLPFLFLDAGFALEVMVIAHFVLASISMWWYCRYCLRTSMWAGFLAAIAFTFSGSTLGHIVLGHQIQVMCLIPLVLLTGHMALERRRLRWSVACAVAIGLTFVAGHVEEWLYVMVALALYGLSWILFRERTGQVRRLGQALLTLGGSVGLFVLLFSWQLLPSLLLRKQGDRDQRPAAGLQPHPGRRERRVHRLRRPLPGRPRDREPPPGRGLGQGLDSAGLGGGVRVRPRQQHRLLPARLRQHRPHPRVPGAVPVAAAAVDRAAGRRRTRFGRAAAQPRRSVAGAVDPGSGRAGGAGCRLRRCAGVRRPHQRRERVLEALGTGRRARWPGLAGRRRPPGAAGGARPGPARGDRGRAGSGPAAGRVQPEGAGRGLLRLRRKPGGDRGRRRPVHLHRAAAQERQAGRRGA